MPIAHNSAEIEPEATKTGWSQVQLMYNGSMLNAVPFALKTVAKTGLRKIGLDVRRIHAKMAAAPLYDDPLEAYYVAVQGHRASFLCPISEIIDLQGFRFCPPNWHPFVAAIQKLEAHGAEEAEALLERYYTSFQPANAAEAYHDFPDAPPLYARSKPHLFRLAPWHFETPEQMIGKIERWMLNDSIHQGKALSIQVGGYPMYGPVSPDKRKIELKRLADVWRSIRTHGYDRIHGDCRFLILRRGSEIRYVIGGGGYHRTAAMAACGYDRVPGEFWPRPAIIDTADVDHWPQVRRGVWSRGQALSYVEHLFRHRVPVAADAMGASDQKG